MALVSLRECQLPLQLNFVRFNAGGIALQRGDEFPLLVVKSVPRLFVGDELGDELLLVLNLLGECLKTLGFKAGLLALLLNLAQAFLGEPLDDALHCGAAQQEVEDGGADGDVVKRFHYAKKILRLVLSR